MKVAFCSSEVFPFAKTGGMADVAGALPFALAKQGCEVKVFMPLYKGIKPRENFTDYGVTRKEGVEFFFIRNDKYFLREYLYGTGRGDYSDNLERFSFFCRQALSIIKKIVFPAQIIHTNDWQTALMNVYLKSEPIFGDSFFKNTKSVFTVHNLAYQGVFDKSKYDKLGLAEKYFNDRYLEFYGRINLLKGGLIFSDMITTVSPTYAKQIQTVDYGCGLEGVLREKRSRLLGILNAVDYDVWNPSRDKYIYKPYCPATIKDKYENKRRFQKELGLKVSRNTLLLGMVSRLASQKGVDILQESLDCILRRCQVVVLGFGDEKYHKSLKKKAVKFKDSFSLHLKFDESLAHRIYAGSDCFLMPSVFEPCGLSQMISYKYGTVPIVYHTGGLVDTVADVEAGGGGFVFDNYSVGDFIATVERAVELFSNKDDGLKLIKRIMNYDFSWKAAAVQYMEVYKKCRCWR